jgi:hypothetical protein
MTKKKNKNCSISIFYLFLIVLALLAHTVLSFRGILPNKKAVLVSSWMNFYSLNIICQHRKCLNYGNQLKYNSSVANLHYYFNCCHFNWTYCILLEKAYRKSYQFCIFHFQPELHCFFCSLDLSVFASKNRTKMFFDSFV